MYSSEILAQRIKAEARRQNLSQKELLSKCELGVNTLTKLSNGTDILAKNLVKIADALNCSIDYLVDRNFKNYDQILSPAERSLLQKFKLVSEDDQKEILMLLDIKVDLRKEEGAEKSSISLGDKFA